MICPRGNRAKYIKMISLRLTDDVNHEPRGNSSNNNNNMYMQCHFSWWRWRSRGFPRCRYIMTKILLLLLCTYLYRLAHFHLYSRFEAFKSRIQLDFLKYFSRYQYCCNILLLLLFFVRYLQSYSLSRFSAYLFFLCTRNILTRFLS